MVKVASIILVHSKERYHNDVTPVVLACNFYLGGICSVY